jgi:hypothetical protein
MRRLLGEDDPRTTAVAANLAETEHAISEAQQQTRPDTPEPESESRDEEDGDIEQTS